MNAALLKFTRAAVLGIVIGLIGGVLVVSRPGLELEDSVGLRWLFAARGPKPAPSEVVIVNIDDNSGIKLGQFGKLRDWTRTLHAELIDKLVEHGVSVIVFDVFFEQARPFEDAAFADAIARAQRVVLFQQAKRERLSFGEKSWLEDPTIELAKVAHGLAPFVLPDVPDRINQGWAFFPAVNYAPTLPMLALQVHALRFVGYKDFVQLLQEAGLRNLSTFSGTAGGLPRFMNKLRAQLRQDHQLSRRLLNAVESGRFPADARRALQALIHAYGRDDYYENFYGPPGTIKTIPYSALWETTGQINESLDLAGKAVFVGRVESQPGLGQGDRFSTAFSEEGVRLSGVEIAATAFANLLTRATLSFPHPLTNLALIMLFGLAAGMMSTLLPGKYAVAAVLVVGILYYGSAQSLFNRYGLCIPVCIPLTVQLVLALPLGLLLQYLITRRQREDVGRAIRYYVPERIAQRHESGSTLQAPELVYGICLFSDVQNYTTLSETLTPQELATLNNEYFDVLGEQISAWNGEILGTGGDGMHCLWAAPQPARELRLYACLAGLGMLRAVEVFNQRHPQEAFPTRIGLNAGWLTTGHMGGAGRFSYDVVGDIANTASRIEGLNKYLGTRLLAAEPVVADLDELLMRPVGGYLLKGKTEVVSIFEIVAERNRASTIDCELCEQFADALETFKALRWSAAALMFERILTTHPLDSPSRFYYKRCIELTSAAPSVADAWVIKLGTK